MRNGAKDEQGHALIDGLILLIFLVIVPLLLLVYCDGALRRVAAWGASHFVCRRVNKSASDCAVQPCEKPAPTVKVEGEQAPVTPQEAGKP